MKAAVAITQATNTEITDLLNAVMTAGWIEIESGAYLNTQENIRDEQTGWPEEDTAKGFDFTAAPYWLTTADTTPIAIHDASDLVAAFSYTN